MIQYHKNKSINKMSNINKCEFSVLVSVCVVVPHRKLPPKYIYRYNSSLSRFPFSSIQQKHPSSNYIHAIYSLVLKLIFFT